MNDMDSSADSKPLVTPLRSADTTIATLMISLCLGSLITTDPTFTVHGPATRYPTSGRHALFVRRWEFGQLTALFRL